MLGRERVQAALEHREGDRVPLYLWVFGQPGVIDDINAAYGDMAAFADALDLDLVQAFPGGGPYDGAAVQALATDQDPTFGAVLRLENALEVAFGDPDNEAVYTPLRQAVEHEAGRRGRAVFVQTPGVFEAANAWLGLQNHLMELALRPELCARFYERIADWSCCYVEHCAELGVDCIHVSDDWGMQSGLMFRDEVWERTIRPACARIAAAARRCGLYCSLHSDGNVTSVLDGIVALGFNALHPVQESAGMDQAQVKREYAGRLAIYGGLDVQTVLGRGRPELVGDEVRRLMRTLKPGGGFIFCTSHMVQPGTPLDEVVAAYAVAREEGRY